VSAFYNISFLLRDRRGRKYYNILRKQRMYTMKLAEKKRSKKKGALLSVMI
jgi:hypothetical protein